jgi:hypothetical protein
MQLSKAFSLLSILSLAPLLNAGQPLETESARLLRRGVFDVETTFELQTSSEGREIAIPLDFEYGISDRTEIAVEPVPYTSIKPRRGHGPSASGPGDVEVTLTHLLLREGSFPALAVAAEVKIPTAKNELIGTGKTDFAGYLILSKRYGRSDTHLNLAYNVLGSPAGTSLSNTVGYAIAEEFHTSPRLDLVAELTGVTSATGEGAEGAPSPVLVAEAPGAERVVLAGMRYDVSPRLTFAFGISYDNNHALLLRPGVTWHLGRH